MNNVDLAYDLFSTLGVGGELKYPKETERILQSTNSRQDVLNKIIDLVGEPNTPKERYIIAKAYSWSYASLSKEAIKYLELYLNNPLYEEYYANTRHNNWFISHPDNLSDYEILFIEKRLHISEMYKYLGDKYLHEKMYNESFNSYKIALRNAPFYAHNWINIYKLYIQIKDYESARDILNKAKNSKYYKKYIYTSIIGMEYTNTSFIDVIDKQISNHEQGIYW